MKMVFPFARVRYHNGPDGYIVWRRGTGDNVELLHLKSVRPGGGSRLLAVMLEALREEPPYATVFGFTRESNTKARNFYSKAGFKLSWVDGVYDDGEAYVFSARYKDLVKRHLGRK